jgi:hypothetical protein
VGTCGGCEGGPCIVLIRSPATTTATGRATPVFTPTLTLIDALPRPAPGATLAHGTSLVAVQAQAGCVRTSIARTPPSAPTVSGTLDTWKRQGAGSSATVTERSPATMVPCRATGSPLASTRYVTLPSPCPWAAEVIAIHGTCDAAVQAHSRATPIVRVPEPPLALKEEGVPVTEAWQRAVDGLVTLVDAELPHAAAPTIAASAATYGRARAGLLTPSRNAGNSPARGETPTLGRARCVHQGQGPLSSSRGVRPRQGREAGVSKRERGALTLCRLLPVLAATGCQGRAITNTLTRLRREAWTKAGKSWFSGTPAQPISPS